MLKRKTIDENMAPPKIYAPTKKCWMKLSQKYVQKKMDG